MADFNRHRRSGGRRDFGRRGSDRPQQMHRAICSDCGNDCSVPFKPTGDKPIYCNNCFKNHGGSDTRRSEERYPRRSNFGDRSDRPMYDAVCNKCGDRCKIPFQPKEGRPVFCSKCFDRSTSNESPDSRKSEERGDRPNYKEQLDSLNRKLDKILTILNSSAPLAVTPIPAPAEEVIQELVAPESKKVSPLVKKKKPSKKAPRKTEED